MPDAAPDPAWRRVAGRSRARLGAGRKRRGAGPQCRRAARAIRARHRHSDRTAAFRTDRGAARSWRRHSENSRRHSLDATGTASRHRGVGADHAAGKCADRRRRGRLFSRYFALQRAAICRADSKLPSARRARSRSIGANGHANSVRWRVDSRRRSTPRARSIGKASPIIGRRFSRHFNKSKTSSPRYASYRVNSSCSSRR